MAVTHKRVFFDEIFLYPAKKGLKNLSLKTFETYSTINFRSPVENIPSFATLLMQQVFYPLQKARLVAAVVF